MRRRSLLRLLAACGLGAAGRVFPVAPDFPAVAKRPLAFPRDHGAHPDYRNEWWYVTGWLDVAGRPAGFQVTFFRTRTAHDPANPSRFAPHQLLLAHAALTWPAHGRLLFDQNALRVVRGDSDTQFDSNDTGLALRGWQLRRESASSIYTTRVDGNQVKLELELVPSQQMLLQGDGGYSRKGSQPGQASHYYSLPQLAVRGFAGLEGRSTPVTGRAWLDHEWSTSVLDQQSVGWDWLGINLDDGGALMAFRIRSRDGGPPRWAAARLRQPGGPVRSFSPDQVHFETQGSWRSPRTGTLYPVRTEVTFGSGLSALRLAIVPLIEDQELDGRMTTGAVYWEGAVTALASDRVIGHGYLELVGYHRPMKI